jgi:GNAT superfamily N-acetyltransferase
MPEPAIRQVRRFNRLVTRRVGALDESYLSRGRPLGEARLLFEIGLAGADARSLRGALDLDSGYLKPPVARVDRRGAGRSRQGAGRRAGQARNADRQGPRRTRRLRPTVGRAGAVDPRAARASRARRRERLLAAMAEVERLLRAGALVVALEPADSAEARWCLERYFAELARRFDAGFDPGKGAAVGAEAMTPPHGWFFLARLDGRPVGCGALRRLGADEGEVKRMWTAPDARGLGVARRIIAAVEATAREAGMTTLRLDTNRALKEAHALYRKLGFVETARYNDNPYADHWFEKRL